jgi:hypothetical protein
MVGNLLFISGRNRIVSIEDCFLFVDETSIADASFGFTLLGAFKQYHDSGSSMLGSQTKTDGNIFFNSNLVCFMAENV